MKKAPKLKPDFMSCSFYIEPRSPRKIEIEKIIEKEVVRVVEVEKPIEVIKVETIEVEKIKEVKSQSAKPRSKSKYEGSIFSMTVEPTEKEIV